MPSETVVLTTSKLKKDVFWTLYLNFCVLIWINCPLLGLFWAQPLAKWPRY